jgi:hypothetical protein
MTEAGVMSTAVYPNPTSGKITVEISSESTGNCVMTLTDMIGRIVLTRSVEMNSGSNTIAMDLTAYEAGVYMLHVVNQNGGTSVTRLVIE